MNMRSLAIAGLLSLGAARTHAGEGRVVFICDDNFAACEYAAQRFEARSRAEGWLLAGRAIALDALTQADLALAMIVVTIDTPLHRHWLLSIKRHEAWTDVPSIERDRAGAEAAIERRLQALAASFAQPAATTLLALDDHRVRIGLPATPPLRVATLRLMTASDGEFWTPLDLGTHTTAGLASGGEFIAPTRPIDIDLDTLHWEKAIWSIWPGRGKPGLPPQPRTLVLVTERRSDTGAIEKETTVVLPRPCPAHDYACFMANVASLGEGLARSEVERRLGAPAEVRAAEPEEGGRDTVLVWPLSELTQERPESPPAWSVEVSLVRGHVVHIRTIGWLERR